ncbi:DUF924 family protein [Benzoatithermus flavus]|uniref:DUF924 family protein n=1 Tax=Benzoatithermus flavus TaxID=3108223 RepID=A0ABU8XM00_9PROT
MSSYSPDEILTFWFAPENRPRWFTPDSAFDAEIARRFGPLIEDAADGRLAAWVREPRGALALCILLDQFPRNVWRGTPRAFAYDRYALPVAEEALARGHDRALSPEERLFLYLPLEHSEDLERQQRCVALMEGLGDPGWLDYAVRHRDIVARFGRFPHRNAVLGRTSTAEEEAFLQEPNASF